jgi:hypothetical protein
MYPNWAGIPALPRMAVAGATGGAVVVELVAAGATAAGTAEEEEDGNGSEGWTKPEVCAVAPAAATGSIGTCVLILLIVVGVMMDDGMRRRSSLFLFLAGA